MCVQTETKNLIGQAVNQLRVLRCAARVCSQFQPVGWLWVSSVERGVCCVPREEPSAALHSRSIFGKTKALTNGLNKAVPPASCIFSLRYRCDSR